MLPPSTSTIHRVVPAPVPRPPPRGHHGGAVVDRVLPPPPTPPYPTPPPPLPPPLPPPPLTPPPPHPPPSPRSCRTEVDRLTTTIIDISRRRAVPGAPPRALSPCPCKESGESRLRTHDPRLAAAGWQPKVGPRSTSPRRIRFNGNSHRRSTVSRGSSKKDPRLLLAGNSHGEVARTAARETYRAPASGCGRCGSVRRR